MAHETFLPLDKFSTKKNDLSSEMIELDDDGDGPCPVCGKHEWMTQRFWVAGNDNSYSLTKNNDPKLVQHKIAWLKCLNCANNNVLTVIQADLPGQR